MKPGDPIDLNCRSYFYPKRKKDKRNDRLERCAGEYNTAVAARIIQELNERHGGMPPGVDLEYIEYLARKHSRSKRPRAYWDPYPYRLTIDLGKYTP